MNLGDYSLRPPTLWLARPESLAPGLCGFPEISRGTAQVYCRPGPSSSNSRLVLQIVWNCELCERPIRHQGSKPVKCRTVV
jgi:hypothetical protein